MTKEYISGGVNNYIGQDYNIYKNFCIYIYSIYMCNIHMYIQVLRGECARLREYVP